MRPFYFWPWLLLLAASACSRPDAHRTPPELAPGAEDAGGFVVLGREDTIAVERYARSPGRLRGTIRHDDGTRIEYDARIADDESIVRLDLRLWLGGAPLDSRPAQQSTTELRGPARDSLVRVDREGAGPARVFRLTVPPGSQPYLIPSVGLAQQALRRARAMGGAGTTLSVVVLNGAASPQRVSVRWLPADSVEVGVAGTRVRLGLDAHGRVREGADPALGIRLVRMPAR